MEKSENIWKYEKEKITRDVIMGYIVLFGYYTSSHLFSRLNVEKVT